MSTEWETSAFTDQATTAGFFYILRKSLNLKVWTPGKELNATLTILIWSLIRHSYLSQKDLNLFRSSTKQAYNQLSYAASLLKQKFFIFNPNNKFLLKVGLIIKLFLATCFKFLIRESRPKFCIYFIFFILYIYFIF